MCTGKFVNEMDKMQQGNNGEEFIYALFVNEYPEATKEELAKRMDAYWNNDNVTGVLDLGLVEDIYEEAEAHDLGVTGVFVDKVAEMMKEPEEFIYALVKNERESWTDKDVQTIVQEYFGNSNVSGLNDLRFAVESAGFIVD